MLYGVAKIISNFFGIIIINIVNLMYSMMYT